MFLGTRLGSRSAGLGSTGEARLEASLLGFTEEDFLESASARDVTAGLLAVMINRTTVATDGRADQNDGIVLPSVELLKAIIQPFQPPLNSVPVRPHVAHQRLSLSQARLNDGELRSHRLLLVNGKLPYPGRPKTIAPVHRVYPPLLINSPLSCRSL